MTTFNPYSYEFHEDPFPVYRDLREHAPCFHNPALDFWALSRYDDVLAALRRSGDPFELTAGELSALTHVTSGTMTSRLDRLSNRNFVSRHPDPTDGRLVRVRLTATGRKRVDAAFGALLDTERELLATLPSSQHAGVADALRQLLLAAGTDI